MADSSLRALRVGRRIVRRLLKDTCEVWRQPADGGAYELVHTYSCAVALVNRDRDVLTEDPEDADVESVDVKPIHFAHDSDVQGSDFIVWTDGAEEYFAETVGIGSHSATKRVLSTIPRMEGIAAVLTLSRETDEVTGAREFVPDQTVYVTVDNLVRDVDTPNPKRRGAFVRVGSFDVQVGDTYVVSILGELHTGMITGVHPGQRRRIEAQFVEPA
jgi:hypothetical protein